MYKPISPLAHGVIDYAFSGVQAFVPPLLNVNPVAGATFKLLACGFAAVNVLTDTPVGLKPLISFGAHKQLDRAFLVGQAALLATPFIRKDKKALLFHAGFLALAVLNYVFTDYRSGSK